MDFQKAIELKQMEDIDINIPLKLPLYDYQKVGAAFMYSVKKCFNLDDPGMGKTPQAIGYMRLLQAELGRRPKVLIVTTSAMIFQWRDELKKFSDYLCVIPDGSKASRTKAYKNFLTDRINAIIINYTKVLHDFDDINKPKYDAIIFDEATSLKDQSSQISKYYHWVCHNRERIVMLTATPITTDLGDFYNLFTFFEIPDYLPPWPEFRDRFLITRDIRVKKGNRTFTVQTVVGSKNVKEFEALMNPFYIRRENTVGGMANLTIRPFRHPTPLTQEQKQLCQKMRLEFFRKKEQDRVALKLYADFIKISCAPAIMDPEASWISPKAMYLTNFVQSSPKKVVIFAKFIEFHKILRKYFEKAGITFVSITGLESSKEKDDAKKRFWTDASVQAILLTGAGKFGLNLHVTNVIFFSDIPETPSDVFQYIGRVMRDGQTEDPEVHFMFSADTVEEDNFKTLFSRQKTIDEFFGQNKAWLFEPEEAWNIDKKQSFLRRDYDSGPYFEDLPQAGELLKLVPPKELTAPQAPQDESSYVSIDDIKL